MDCCFVFRDVNSMVAKYRADQMEIFNILISSPKDLVGRKIINSDNRCLCHMGESIDKMVRIGERTKYACSGCRQIRRLVDLHHGVIGAPFLIECGSMQGNRLIINKRKDIINSTITIGHHQKKNNDITYVKCDPFTNEILVNWIINAVLGQYGIPSGRDILTAFICGTDGYTLEHYDEVRLLIDLKENLNKLDICTDIIIQSINILTALCDYDFILAEPSLRSLSFALGQTRYSYQNANRSYRSNVAGEFRVIINPLDSSSIGVNKNIRVYSMPSHFITPIDEIYSFPSAETVTINEKMLKELIAYRKNNLLIYPGLLEVYGIFIGLMAEKDLFQVIKDHEYLNNIWIKLFSPSQLSSIESRIIKTHSRIDNLPLSFEQIAPMLIGLEIPIDPLSQIASLINIP